VRGNRNYVTWYKLAFILATIVLPLVLNTAEAQAASLNRTWKVVSSPSGGYPNNRLFGVATRSSNDAWAVGYSSHDINTPQQALIEHWDGTQWSIVANPGVGGSELHAVAIVSANDVWAVGSSSGYNKTLIEHWDGTSWSIVPSPVANGSLSGVAAISSSDVWAVGNDNNSPLQTLVLHYDGTNWSVVPSPNPGTYNNFLAAVTALSTNDVWAVGTSVDKSFHTYTLTEHWNGTSWQAITSPNPGLLYNDLFGVAAHSSSDVWVVGYQSNINGNPFQTVIEHWNGSSWSVIPSPNPGASYNALDGVTAIAGKDAWAVGAYQGNSRGNKTLIEHWNGKSWRITSSPSPDTYNELWGVAAVSANNLWAVGDTAKQFNTFQTLTEQYCSC
jgi:hypothetical protein